MHIDYFRRVGTMLALPVERLVGNSSGRMISLSPDSTSTVSSVISSGPPSSETDAGESVKCNCSPTSPSSSLSADDNNHHNNKANNNNEVRIKEEEEEGDRDRDHHHRLLHSSINNRKSGEDVNHHVDNHTSAQDHQQEEEVGDIDVDGDGDRDETDKFNNNNNPNFGLNLTTGGGNKSSTTGNNNKMTTTVRAANDKNNMTSSSSSSCSSSTTSSHHSLKFSIEDILRPDFGLSRFQLLTQQHSLKRPSKSVLPSPPAKRSSCSSVSSQDGHTPYKRSSTGSSSFVYHSEDSNGSCTSKTSKTSSLRNREPEVVDDAKVNPAVPEGPLLWPAWVYCTRYSDRPSSGPRSRRIRKDPKDPEEKRPRTAFTAEQLSKLKQEFDENRYLTEKRRQDLARDLKLHENQIKIWFQNKRAKLKKSTGGKNGLALQLMAQGLYNHSTVPVDEDDEMMMM